MRRRLPHGSRVYAKRMLRAKLIAGMCCAVLLGSLPVPLRAAVNPSMEELAKLFEEVGKEKNIPPEILKAIAYHESTWMPFDRNGEPRMGAGIYAGVMQVDTQRVDEETLYKLQYDVRFNIAYGADMLNAKWDMAPVIGDGDRTVLENWYFAIWAYNSWIPNNKYPDKIVKLMANPPYPASAVTTTPYAIPAGTLPKKDNSYPTPAPAHFSFELTGEKTLAIAASTTPPQQEDPAVPVMSPAQIEEEQRSKKEKEHINSTVKRALSHWINNSNTAYVSRSSTCPDGMIGVALGGMNYPLLITTTAELDNRVLAELQRLKPARVILLNDCDALPDAVSEQIREVLNAEVEIIRES